MGESPSPFSVPEPWNLVANAYAEETAPFFAEFSREALRIAGIGRGDQVVDVAAGPGTLSFEAAGLGACVQALDFSHGMVAQLRNRIATTGTDRVVVQHGDGQALPFEHASFDAAFSMFGLMFFPDRSKGLSELHRVLKLGGRAAISSWVPFERVPHFVVFMTTLLEQLPEQPSGPGFAFSTPEECVAAFEAAGFANVECSEHAATRCRQSMDELLVSMERTAAPVALIRQSVGEDAFAQMWQVVGDRMRMEFGNGPQETTMTALITSGTKP